MNKWYFIAILPMAFIIQGVQDQNLPKEMAISLKGSISDHKFVKSKFVSGKNNFFGKF